MDAVQQRLDRMPEAMLARKRTVEQVFGTLEHWMGWTHIMMLRKVNVATEMSLHVLAHTLKRAISTIGASNLINPMRLAGA
jgi:hypothetical protein